MPDFSAVAYHFGRMLQAESDVPIGLIHNAVGGSPMEAWIPNATANPNWLETAELPKWVAGRARLNLTHWAAKPVLPVPHHPFEPGFLFESGVRPFTDSSGAWVIWYQGESNATEDGAGSPAIDPRKISPPTSTSSNRGAAPERRGATVLFCATPWPQPRLASIS